MGGPKDDPLAIELRALFGKLRTLIDKDPSHLRADAEKDDGIRALCIELYFKHFLFQQNEREARELFRHPVDQSFIEVRREYDDKWASVIADVATLDILGEYLLEHSGGTDFSADPSVLFHFEWAEMPRRSTIISASGCQATGTKIKEANSGPGAARRGNSADLRRDLHYQ